MNKFIKDFGIGFSAYGKALELIFANGLWWFFIFPIILNVLFFFGGFAVINYITEYITHGVLQYINGENASYVGAGFIQGFLSGFIWLVLKILFFFVFAYLGGYIVIIFLSPVYSVLSEKTEKILSGKKYPFDPDQMMRDIVRGIMIAFRNLFIEILYFVAIFVLSFIPLVGQLSAIFLFFVSSYFYGFSFMDYTIERQRYTIRQSVQFMRQNKGVVVANGVLFSLFMLIPFCGTTLAGFISIISVVAATISTHKVLTLPSNN